MGVCVGADAPPWAESVAAELAVSGAPTVDTRGDLSAPDHLLVLEPDGSLALEAAVARLDRRGTTWVITGDHAEGAAWQALLRVASVEGRQRVHAATAAQPGADTVADWLSTQPRPLQGPSTPGWQLDPLEPPTTDNGPVTIQPDGPLSGALAGGCGPVAVVVEAPDCAVQRLTSLPTSQELAAITASERPVVLPADPWTLRPGSSPSAMRAAAAAWHLRQQRGRPWLWVGPVGSGPRTLGVAGLDAEQVRHGLLGGRGELWIDVDWSQALEAFPHMHDLAGHLVDHPVLRRGRVTRWVADEVARLLRRPSVPTDQPLADLGVDSLLAEELRQRLVSRLGEELPLTLVIDHPTAAAIGRWISSRTGP